MECFFTQAEGPFCSSTLTKRYHPTLHKFIWLCDKCLPEWDKEIREHFLPPEEE